MIFYFSGTGNTRWAARQLAEATGEELQYIPDALNGGRQAFRLKDGERLGFCFPTHGWQPPRIVREFVRKMSIEWDGAGRPFIYALTTCGDNMGHAMRIFSKELQLRRLTLDSCYAVVMPESNVCFPFLHLDSDERAAEKIKAARQRLTNIAAEVKERRKGVTDLVRGAIPYTYSYIIGGYYNRHLISDSKLWVETDACIGCGLCSKKCPVGDIEGTPPAWKHNGRCTNCLACYHYCPSHAIHWGNMQRGQYTLESTLAKADL